MADDFTVCFKRLNNFYILSRDFLLRTNSVTYPKISFS